MMRNQAPQPSHDDEFSRRALWNRIQTAAVEAGEGALRELPLVLRRLRTLALVLSIAVPVFLAGLLMVLWRLAH